MTPTTADLLAALATQRDTEQTNRLDDLLRRHK